VVVDEGGTVVELLTIGAFAAASGLSPKALRLYDDLGLLAPAEVDGRTGYRRYHPDQLEHALLVAWLRRLGVPLARIRVVTALPRAAAAAEVATYWRAVEADHLVRRELAASLVDHLDGRDHPMTGTTLVLHCAARTDRGLVRPENQDAARAGERVVVVADGFGPAGARAATVAAEALLAGPSATGDVLGALRAAAQQADAAVRDLDDGAESGTTLTALACAGSELALVHVGDSRAYLLRAGALTRLTHDHTLVQSLLDEGRLTPAEAESHPQRLDLVRALHGGGPSRPDALVQQARAGDRYLLGSDGLHRVLPDDVLRTVLAEAAGPQEAVDELVRRVHAAGAPDNVAVAVADVAVA
jgi:serine/threonine protein phosphatase PrpC